MHYSFKKDLSCKPTYLLKNASVCINKSGFHYIDYLDPIDNLNNIYDMSKLNEYHSTYIEEQLQSNSKRLTNQINLVSNYLGELNGKKILDIGCGGGGFLCQAKQNKAITKGIELSDERGAYCIKNGLDVVKIPIDSDYWNESRGTYDAVTVWDVIEHVNDPESVVDNSYNLLKDGGCLFIDTPCRDSFYHRIGVFTYKLTKGRYPTFLNIMYSSHMFGHKQIFSSNEMIILLKMYGFKSVSIIKFHELTFPYDFYLMKMINSKRIVKKLSKIVALFFKFSNIKNKIYVVGMK